MDMITFVIDAPTLIDQIHGLKQWVYDGSIRLLVPLSTSEEVDRQYQASLKPKEAPKEPTSKRASGRAPRREEHPLFDINPRTTWEFLSRERADTQGRRVSFQSEGEEFSQWKNESILAAGPDSPLEPPSSFADALLRKLNMTDGPSPTITKAPTKPKLVTRGSDPKSPWKVQKVPTIPSERVPANLRPFFSCALWRLYEAQGDPVQPTKYIILANGTRVRNVAAMLGLPICDWTELRAAITEQLRAQDHRATHGRLESDFPKPATIEHKASPFDGAFTNPGALEASKKDAHPNLASEGRPSSQILLSGENLKLHDLLLSESPNIAAGNTSSSSATQPQEATVVKNPPAKATLGPGFAPSDDPTTKKANEESEIDSDEEIIVFNPRSKRLSGRPRTPGGISEPSASRPATANGPKAENVETPKPTKSPVKSTLKPQSPAFTPGQLYTPVVSIEQNGQPNIWAVQSNEFQQFPPKSPSRSPLQSHAKPASPHRPSNQTKPKQLGADEARRQQNEIIQRQREAIQRQTKAAPKAQPRKVQMEPTEHPTIIDPDDFDRSQVVQPPSQHSDRGSKRRGSGRPQRNSRGNMSQMNGRQESEEEFVLKSGAPRGSMRGKGKLFVP